MDLLNDTIAKVADVDKEFMVKARERLDSLVKPLGSLGRLEEIAIRLSGITKELYPNVDNKTIIVMAADNGVCAENVTSAPQEVTKLQAINMTKGVCGINALARQSKAKVIVADIGIMSDVNNDKIVNKKIKYGTDNIRIGPAMSKEEAIKSIEVGIELANGEINNGCNILGTGEMGIGNTTTSTAILSVFGKIKPKLITGIGANYPRNNLKHKVNVIEDAIKINKPNPKDPIDVLAKVGGLEIGGMVGIILAGAANRVPVVIDGYISTMAAILAFKIEPKTIDYIFPSHSSSEKGAKYATKLLGLRPMLDMKMRLGEGSGAAMAFNIIEGATYIMKDMITFEESNIKPV